MKYSLIQNAQHLLKNIAYMTPMDYGETFSKLSGNNVYLKLENLQKTGSFKIRGAYNKILSLNHKEQRNGVIAVSAGNHAQGVAFASRLAGITSTIIMPISAPLAKVQATKNYGSEVVLYGETFDDALEYAKTHQQKTSKTFIHPFDDELIIAGQGTVGLEIMSQLPEIEAIVCPIGGGGLIAGIAIAVKTLKPSVKIYGVESAACPSMTTSLKENKPVKVLSSDTIADGIAVKQPSDLTYTIVKKYIDDIVLVDDLEISSTMFYLMERGKLIVEGSGAAALAALLYHKLPFKGKNVVPIISGGNVDMNFLSKIIEHSLAEDGRFITISIISKDKPDCLDDVLQIISREKANITSLRHHRTAPHILPNQVEVELSLETRNHTHIDQIKKALLHAGFHFNSKN
ncbi:threonine ammonia-lyase [Bacillus taeanensis]|uniref:L-threonine dehydratase catabolic TdcB n=1 Tax=Bacillus taeanensis TaxID=273032 RepID=A0A366Y2V2_9BACI|nr:threonine ammonia-lyase [Bacillus taeanensis]RBW70733.1 threonine ammonia-lyase [Bacillus taeanensis]